jgi:hypothetical protein
MSERIPDDLSGILRRLTRAQAQVLQVMARYARQNRSEDVPSHYIQERYGRGTSVYNVLKKPYGDGARRKSGSREAASSLL